MNLSNLLLQEYRYKRHRELLHYTSLLLKNHYCPISKKKEADHIRHHPSLLQSIFLSSVFFYWDLHYDRVNPRGSPWWRAVRHSTSNIYKMHQCCREYCPYCAIRSICQHHLYDRKKAPQINISGGIE